MSIDDFSFIAKIYRQHGPIAMIEILHDAVFKPCDSLNPNTINHTTSRSTFSIYSGIPCTTTGF